MNAKRLGRSVRPSREDLDIDVREDTIPAIGWHSASLFDACIYYIIGVPVYASKQAASDDTILRHVDPHIKDESVQFDPEVDA